MAGSLHFCRPVCSQILRGVGEGEGEGGGVAKILHVLELSSIFSHGVADLALLSPSLPPASYTYLRFSEVEQKFALSKKSGVLHKK